MIGERRQKTVVAIGALGSGQKPGLIVRGANYDMAKGQFAAEYDTNRQSDGKFAPGNKIAAGWNSDLARRFNALRASWMDAINPDDMDAVKRELVTLALTCPVPDVKLRAIVYFLDRTYGKPTERLEVESDNTTRAMGIDLDLSAAEVAALEKVVARAAAAEVVNEVPAALPESPSPLS